MAVLSASWWFTGYSPGTASAESDIPGLQRYAVESIVLPAVASESLVVTIPIDGLTRSLRLQRHSLRSLDFQILAQGPDGEFRESNAPFPSTYRGNVDGLPGSRVAATLRGEHLEARVELGSDRIWNVQPLSTVAATADSAAHIVYLKEDVIPQDTGCGATGTRVHSVSQAIAAQAAAAGATRKVCDIAFDADVEFYRANGSSITQTVNDIETIMNQVSLIYEAEVNLTFEITTILIRTAEPDPYSSTNNQLLLDQFKAEWNNNRGGVQRDIAHLMTGKNVDSNIIGTAFTGTVCEVCGNAEGYGFSESRFSQLMAERTCLTAHEIGHNFGARHCDGDADCFIMCSHIGSCGGSCTQFGSRSLSSINSGILDSLCVSNLSPPAELPFCDTFEQAIAPAAWSYNAIATLSSGSRSPPSGILALMFDACCTGCANAPDEIRSNAIRLGAAPQATLAYFTQHAGGSATAGSQFIVDYWNSLGDWIELNRISANGTTQNAFVSWQHGLPADALHDEFRVRFRQGGLTNQATWFLDSVSITSVDIDSPILYVRAGSPGGNGSSWATAFGDLQDALASAACSQGVVREIHVAAGTYKPDRGSGDRSASFRLLNGVAIYGGFKGTEVDLSERNVVANPTILGGDIGVVGNPSDNSYHVVVNGVVDETAILDGFTISGGQATGGFQNDGGGGLINDASSPSIRNCTFRDNIAGFGGAVYNASGASPVMTNCRFIDNTATSLGGAVYNTTGSTPKFMRCRFLRNFAGSAGGAIYSISSAINVVHSAFSGNLASTGGAIQNFGSSAVLIHCTLSGNSALALGGGLVNSNSFAMITGSILWGNSDASGGSVESAQVFGSKPAVDYSVVQGWSGSFGGTGSSGTDPRMIDANGPDNIFGTVDDNPRLRQDSPVINLGDPNYPKVAADVDLDGHPRVLCGSVDIGAYEFGIGDFDCDRSVKTIDGAAFADCLTGPGLGPYAAGCEALDFDGDSDIDLTDLFEFARLPLVP